MIYHVYYTNVCRFCGKSGGTKKLGSSSGGPPISTPFNIPGSCPSSPTGKHAPYWQEV